MAPPEVNREFVAELEAMGFTVPQAINALRFSGNTSVEAAIDWIIEHENETDVESLPLVILDIPIEEAPMTSQVIDKQSEYDSEVKEDEDIDNEKSSTRLADEHVKPRNTTKETEQRRYLSEWKTKKMDERRAKAKILEKLQQDKVERRGRLTLPTERPVFLKSNMLINQKKKKKKLELDDSFRKVELMEECLRSIRRQNMGNDTQGRKAFQTLFVYIRNVANFPDNGRFRRIRFTNPAFRDRVGNYKGGVEFLEYCGFVKVEDGEFLFLPRDKVDMRLLKAASDLLHSAITNPFFGLLSNSFLHQTITNLALQYFM